MRILHFGRFWSDNPGGIERHVDLLLTELARHLGANGRTRALSGYSLSVMAEQTMALYQSITA